LDQYVWDQIIGLLDNEMLIRAEIDRRKEAARNSDPQRQRTETLRREQARLGNNVTLTGMEEPCDRTQSRATAEQQQHRDVASYTQSSIVSYGIRQ
jgi:hypothetical protein